MNPTNPPDASAVPAGRAPRFGLTVGPVLYYWPRAQLQAFYAQVADSPADCVVLGEVVCARRRELRLDDWLALGRELAQAGKQVVLAMLALVETEADLRLIERLGDQSLHAVEAGDVSALALLHGRVPLVLGPHINIYSAQALREHAGLGVLRWVPPLELSLESVAAIRAPADARAAAIETEVWAFGRLPLSFSARCFTARQHGVRKDQCGYPCLDDADGRVVNSGEGERFLVINGTQTQSAGVHCLLGQQQALVDAGVQRLRLSPQSRGFAQVIEDFDATFNRGQAVDGRTARWAELGVPQPLVCGYAFGAPGMQAASDRTLERTAR